MNKQIKPIVALLLLPSLQTLLNNLQLTAQPTLAMVSAPNTWLKK